MLFHCFDNFINFFFFISPNPIAEVLTLLRSHRDDNSGLIIMPNRPYPIQACRLWNPFQWSDLEAAAQAANPGDNLKTTLANALPWGPALAEHCLRSAGIDPSTSVRAAPAKKPAAAAAAAKKGASQAPKGKGGGKEKGGKGKKGKEAEEEGDGEEEAATAAEPEVPPGRLNMDAEQRTRLEAAILELEAWLRGCKEGTAKAPGGYITLTAPGVKGKKGSAAESAAAPTAAPAPALYDSFESLPLRQHADAAGAPLPRVEFTSFDDAVSEFYSRIQDQRTEQQRAAQEKQVLTKLERVRADHETRAKALEEDARLQEFRAQLIEQNLELVENAILSVNAALANGLDWRDVSVLIKCAVILAGFISI